MGDTLYFVNHEGVWLYAGDSLLSIADLSVRLGPAYWTDLSYKAKDSDGERPLALWENREVLRYIDDLIFDYNNL